jgi:hypothetical protein
MRRMQQRSPISPAILLIALGAALAYAAWLRRSLTEARQRGDMYRDIAAELDRQRGS